MNVTFAKPAYVLFSANFLSHSLHVNNPLLLCLTFENQVFMCKVSLRIGQ